MFLAGYVIVTNCEQRPNVLKQIFNVILTKLWGFV